MKNNNVVQGRSTTWGALATVVLLLTSGNVAAANLNVINPGFEDISGETVLNEFTFGALNGWDAYAPSPVVGDASSGPYYIGTLTPQPDPLSPGDFINFPGGALQGERVGIAFNFAGTDLANGGSEYGFQQTLVDVLEANTRYILSVGIGNIDSGQSVGSGFFNLRGFPGYRVDLLAGDQVLESDNNSLAGTIADGEFGYSTVEFRTGASHALLGQSLGIRLVNLNVADANFPTDDLEVDFDDVSLTAVVVPIPAAWPLFVVAFMIAARRRGHLSSQA